LGFMARLLGRPRQRAGISQAEAEPEGSSASMGLVIAAPSAWYTYGWPPRVDWYRIERVYRGFPLVSYAVEKMAEQAVGPGFYLRGDNPRAMSIVEEFNDRVNLRLQLLRVAKELLLYGNCFMERRFDALKVDLKDEFQATRLGNLVDVQILPVTTMRVVPEPSKGLRGYVQLIMGVHRKMPPECVAHFRFNVVGGAIGSDFYGMGVVQPILDYVDQLRAMEDYMLRIMRRYASPKVHWRLGDPEHMPRPQDLAEWAGSLKTVSPDEDYVSSYLAQATVLEPDLRARFEEYLDHYLMMVVAGLQDPTVILSTTKTRVSDASATAMLESQTRKVNALRDAMKELVQDLIFKPLIAQAGLDPRECPSLAWGQVPVQSPESRLEQLLGLLNPQTVQVSEETRRDIEKLLRQELELDAWREGQEPPLSPRRETRRGERGVWS